MRMTMCPWMAQPMRRARVVVRPRGEIAIRTRSDRMDPWMERGDLVKTPTPPRYLVVSLICVGSRTSDSDIPCNFAFTHSSHESFPTTDEFGIRMLPADELKPVMNDQIQEAVEVLGIPSSAAAILLREHLWAKERLFQSFFDNPEAVQEKCGVLARCRNATGVGEKKPILSRHNTRSSSTVVVRKCEICMDEDGFDPSEMISMPCGHEFCETCWYGYIANALEKGPLCVRETCPQAGCRELLSEEEVGRAAPDLLPKFENYQLRSFVETYGLTRWCPGPGCGQVALAPGSGGVFADTGGVAKCNACDTSFCLKCGVEPHAPVTCQHLARWHEKCRNESETANWILANTKPCPKCSSRIEKNQGCNVS
jgi:ariadne-1